MDAEKLEKSKNNLLKQLEEKKKIKKFKKKTKEESAFSDEFGSNEKRRAGVGNLLKFSKGGRAMLRGGGICKRGMNKKAVGKNS